MHFGIIQILVVCQRADISGVIPATTSLGFIIARVLKPVNRFFLEFQLYSTTLLGIKDGQVGEVVSSNNGVVVKIIINAGQDKCPHCGSAAWARHVRSLVRASHLDTQ